MSPRFRPFVAVLAFSLVGFAVASFADAQDGKKDPPKIDVKKDDAIKGGQEGRCEESRR